MARLGKPQGDQRGLPVLLAPKVRRFTSEVVGFSDPHELGVTRGKNPWTSDILDILGVICSNLAFTIWTHYLGEHQCRTPQKTHWFPWPRDPRELKSCRLCSQASFAIFIPAIQPAPLVSGFFTGPWSKKVWFGYWFSLLSKSSSIIIHRRRIPWGY